MKNEEEEEKQEEKMEEEEEGTTECRKQRVLDEQNISSGLSVVSAGVGRIQ